MLRRVRERVLVFLRGLVEEALRAWLRWELAWARDADAAATKRLERLEHDAYNALTYYQVKLRAKMRAIGPGSDPVARLMLIYGHEPEFKDAAKQK